MRRVFGAPLASTWEVEVSEPPAEVLARLRGHVTPLEGGFTLVSKLSGGGIVTRVLRAPAGDRPLFGRVGEDGFRLAAVPAGPDQSPFQPLMSGQVEAAGGGGTRVMVSLAPHPMARTHAGLFALGGLLLLLAAGARAGHDPAIAGFLALVAAPFFVFPTLRARRGFSLGCALSLGVLQAALETDRPAEAARAAEPGA